MYPECSNAENHNHNRMRCIQINSSQSSMCQISHDSGGSLLAAYGRLRVLRHPPQRVCSCPQRCPQASALRLCSPPWIFAFSTPATLRFTGRRYPFPWSCYPTCPRLLPPPHHTSNPAEPSCWPSSGRSGSCEWPLMTCVNAAVYVPIFPSSGI